MNEPLIIEKHGDSCISFKREEPYREDSLIFEDSRRPDESDVPPVLTVLGSVWTKEDGMNHVILGFKVNEAAALRDFLDAWVDRNAAAPHVAQAVAELEGGL